MITAVVDVAGLLESGAEVIDTGIISFSFWLDGRTMKELVGSIS